MASWKKLSHLFSLAKRSAGKRPSSRKWNRRVLLEALEDRRLLTTDLDIEVSGPDPSTIYEYGEEWEDRHTLPLGTGVATPPPTPGSNSGFAVIEVQATGSIYQTGTPAVDIAISGDDGDSIAVYVLETRGIGSTESGWYQLEYNTDTHRWEGSVRTYYEYNVTEWTTDIGTSYVVIQALEDCDLIGEELSIDFYYFGEQDPNDESEENFQSETAHVTLSLVDDIAPPKPPGPVTLATSDSLAVEPYHNFYLNTGAINTGAFVLSTSSSWLGGYVHISFSGSAEYGRDYHISTTGTANLVVDGGTQPPANSVSTIYIPAGSSTRTYTVVPNGDLFAEGNETVIMSFWLDGSCSSTATSGNALVTIEDTFEHGYLVTHANGDTPEFRVDENYATIRLSPSTLNGNATISSHARIEIDTSRPDSAIPGVDYQLVYGTEILGIVPTVPDPENPGKYLRYSTTSSVFSGATVNVKVIPFEDHKLEGDEYIVASVYTDPAGSVASHLHGSVTVKIYEDYRDAQTVKDSLAPDAAQAGGVNLYSGSFETTNYGADIEYSSQGQQTERPILRVKLKLPDDKAKPFSLDASIDVVEKNDETYNNEPLTRGRTPIARVLTLSNIELTPEQFTEEGDDRFVWITLQPDLTDVVSYWDSANGYRNTAILNLEVLVHPNFREVQEYYPQTGTAPPPTTERFSGWVGRHAHLMTAEFQSSISKGFAPGTSIPGIDRAILNTQILVPDVPTNATNSNGRVKTEFGSAFFFSNDRSAWYTGSTIPESLTTLANSTLTDRYNSKVVFAGVNAQTLIDPQGNLTQIGYDSFGRVITIEDPFHRITTYSYFEGVNSGVPNPATTAMADRVRVTYPDGDVVWMKYDRSLTTLTIEYPDPDGSGPRKALVETWTYEDDQLKQVRYKEKDGSTILWEESFVYEFSRLNSWTTTNGGTISIDYFGLSEGLLPYNAPTNNYMRKSFSEEARFTDALGNPSLYTTDHRGRLATYLDALQFERLYPNGDTLTTPLLVQRAAVSTINVLPSARRDAFGKVTGSISSNETESNLDLGLVESTRTPDPDYVYSSQGVVNGGRQPQTTSFHYNSYAKLDQTTQVAIVPNDSFSHGFEYDETFDIVTAYTDELGNKHRQNVNAIGLVTSKKTEKGATEVAIARTDYEYTDGSNGLPKGLVTKETVFTGREVNNVTTFEYYDSSAPLLLRGKIKKITEGALTVGNVTTFEYDTKGRLSKSTDPFGGVTYYLYDDLDRVVVTIYPQPETAVLPAAVRYEYDALGRVIATEQFNCSLVNDSFIVTSIVTGTAYTDSSYLTVVNYSTLANFPRYLILSSPGNVQYSNNYALGTGIDFNTYKTFVFNRSLIANNPATTPGIRGVITTSVYDASGSLTSITEQDATQYYTNSRVTSYVPDALGRTTKILTPNPGLGLQATPTDVRENGRFVTETQYDNLGNVISVKDGLGRTTSFYYDDLNRLLTRFEPGKAISDPPLQTSYTYTRPTITFGWIITETDPLNHSVYTKTDALGRVIDVLGDTRPYSYTYWDDGNLRTIATPGSEPYTFDVTEFEYDEIGRLLAETKPAPSTGAPRPQTVFSYTATSIDQYEQNGNLFRTYLNGVGSPIVTTQYMATGENGQRSIFYRRDSLGNLTQQANYEMGSEFSIDTTDYRYDAHSNLTAIIDPLQNSTFKTYDVFGNPFKVIDPNLNMTEFQFNDANQAVAEFKFEGATNYTGYRVDLKSYDGVGNLRVPYDRNDRYIFYGYDSRNRVESETWRTSVGATVRTITYKYDNSDNLIEVRDSDPLATDFDFYRNSLGLVEVERQSIDVLGGQGALLSLKRDYDLEGHRIGLRLNIGASFSTGATINGGVNDFQNYYAYDGLDRLTFVSQQSVSGGNAVAPKSVAFGYNLDSQITDMRRYSSATVDPASLEVHSRYAYNMMKNISTVTHSKTELDPSENWNGVFPTADQLPSSKYLAAYAIRYSTDGKVANFASFRDGSATKYDYDANDRLTSALTQNVVYLGGSQLASVYSIPIVNPSFELDAIGSDGQANGALGWNVSQSGYAGRLDAATSYYDYTNGTTATDGLQTGWVDSGYLSQVLTTTLTSSTLYTLTVDVGDRLDKALPNYRIELWAGGNLLESVSRDDFPVTNGKFATATLLYTSGASVTAGQALEIRLVSPNNQDHSEQVNFDNVRLTRTPVAAIDIPVLNSSFEYPVQGDGHWSLGTIDDWTISGSAGLLDVPSQYQWYFVPPATDNQTASVNYGTISQTLASNLEPNYIYTLKVDVRDRLALGFPNYSVELWAGNMMLKQITRSQTHLDEGMMNTATLQYISPSEVPSGMALQIRLSSLEQNVGQVNFDNVRLTKTPISVTSIGVADSSFESPSVGGDGLSSTGTITGWTIDDTARAGLFNPDSDAYPNGLAPNGEQVAWSTGGTISKVLSNNLEPNTTYTLSVNVGRRSDIELYGYSIELWTGGSILKRASEYNFYLAPGTFKTAVLQYTSPADVAAGQLLEIRLSAPYTDSMFVSETNFDNVRLTTAPASFAVELYSWDANGNRRAYNGPNQSANGTQNRLQTDGIYNYEYDNAGNTSSRTKISDGTFTAYTWDYHNQLSSVTFKSSATGSVLQKIQYGYDAFGRRVTKLLDKDGNGTWDQVDGWVWDGEHEVLQLTDTDGPGGGQPFRTTHRYLYGDAVDQLLADEQYNFNTGYAYSGAAFTNQGQTLWALGDHQNSVRDVSDNNQIVRQHVVFDSFGIRLKEIDYNLAGAEIPANDATSIDELFGYTGRDWDKEAGLQYNRARWYDPTIGRWMSPDPIGFEAGDANLYRYVGNHPTSTTDPSGLWWDPIGDFARWWVGPSKKQEDRASGVDPEKARQSILASNVDYGSKAVTEQTTKTRQGYYDNSANMQEGMMDAVGVGAPWRLATKEHLTYKVTTNGDLVLDGVEIAAAPIAGAAGKLGSAAKTGIKQAAKGPVKVVLGLDKYLDDFARSHEGKKVLQLANDPVNWKLDFYRLMSDPSQQILFNLKGVDVWPGVARASSGRNFGATDWELLQIYSNKDWWPRITWIDEFGKVAPNPFE